MESIKKFYNSLVVRKDEKPLTVNKKIEECTGVQVTVDGLHTVKCQVCQALIKVLVDDSLPNTVKCNNCNEDTPVKEAPIGYDYVRCECNCLLLAEVRPTELRCTKPDCKKIIRECQTCCRLCAYPFCFYPEENINHCSHCTQFSQILHFFLDQIFFLIYFSLSIFFTMVFFLIDSANDDKNIVSLKIYIIILVVMMTVSLHSYSFLLRLKQMDRPITIMGLAKKVNDKLNSFYYKLVNYQSTASIGFPN